MEPAAWAGILIVNSGAPIDILVYKHVDTTSEYTMALARQVF